MKIKTNTMKNSSSFVFYNDIYFFLNNVGYVDGSGFWIHIVEISVCILPIIRSFTTMKIKEKETFLRNISVYSLHK